MARKVLTQDYQSVLASQTLPSLKRIIAVRDDPEASPGVRLAAAKEILDRAVGKSVNRVEAQVASTVKVEQSSVDKALAALPTEALAAMLDDLV
jgi:hypothetical protein